MTDPNTTNDAVSQQARDWVLRLTSGEMSVAEIDRFKAWLAESDAHARAFELRRSLWSQLGNQPELFTQAQPPVTRRRSAKPAMRRRHKTAVYAMAIAASLVAFLAIPEAILRMEADHLTTNAIGKYALPDGSIAWLDAGSAISIDYDTAERKVTLLRGNAYFTVRHGKDRPFRVAALGGMIEDIGTSFEVRRQKSKVDVAVTDGAVRLMPNTNGNTALVLRRGDGASYSESGVLLEQTTSSPDGVAAWRRKELMIDRQPISTAIHEIARYRSGPTWIWADLSGGAAVNGAFRIDDADTALRDLAAVQGLSVTWLPGDIAIIRRANTAP